MRMSTEMGTATETRTAPEMGTATEMGTAMELGTATEMGMATETRTAGVPHRGVVQTLTQWTLLILVKPINQAGFRVRAMRCARKRAVQPWRRVECTCA